VWIGDDEAATIYFDADNQVILKEWQSERQMYLNKARDFLGL
jgi:hypothetical protein